MNHFHDLKALFIKSIYLMTLYWVLFIMSGVWNIHVRKGDL